MTSRERVLTALEHEEPDRIPIVIGVSNATGMKMKPYRHLKNVLGIQSADRFIYDWPELGTAAPDEETLVRLHCDVRGVLDRFPESIYTRNRSRPPHSPFVDDWGSGQKEIEPGAWFPGVYPLAQAESVADIERYSGWPDMDDPYRVVAAGERAEALHRDGEYAVMAIPWLLFPFERAFAMQGMDTFLMNLALHEDMAVALLEKIADLCKILMGHFLEAVGPYLDIIKIGDDLGTQEGLLLSPDMYRRILKPIHADFIAFIKARTRAKVFFHTDGDVFDLIDDFIEMGIDILNPVQTSAGRMSNLRELKKRCGRNIALCGAIDTHRILPHGSPVEVREEVRRVIGQLGPGGGYMLAAVHTIMDEVPPENILAMVDGAVEFGTYHR